MREIKRSIGSLDLYDHLPIMGEWEMLVTVAHDGQLPWAVTQKLLYGSYILDISLYMITPHIIQNTHIITLCGFWVNTRGAIPQKYFHKQNSIYTVTRGEFPSCDFLPRL